MSNSPMRWSVPILPLSICGKTSGICGWFSSDVTKERGEVQTSPLNTSQDQIIYPYKTKKPRPFDRSFVFALPIFPGSHPPSIVGVHELNFCVRDGNRWTLMTINTNYFNSFYRAFLFGAPSGTRTRDPLIKSQLLYQLS